MMNIVIIGAGDVGLYIATILSKEQHNIILVDKNGKKLQEAASSLDVATREGSGTDWQLLDDLLELSPNLLLALTDNDEVNLVACSIGKHLGYPRTVARVRDNRYLNRTRLDFARIFEVDYFIGPDILVANDILKYMITPGSLAVENFAHGAVQLRTISVPQKWKKYDKPLSSLNLPKGLIVGLIRREIRETKSSSNFSHAHQVIFPHGDDYILPGDEVTFIGETDVIADANHFFNISQKSVQSAVILGGSLTGINLAKLLARRDIHVRIIDKDYDVCCELTELLPSCTIIHHNGTDYEFLLSEKVDQTDVFVTCTRSDETNLMAAMLAKQAGCENVVVMLSNTSYTSLLPQLGINYAVSPRISAANHILSQVLSGKVTSLVSLYENQAEIMEINVSLDSKIVGIPLASLGPLLPKDFLIAMIQNRGRIMIANGNRIISPGDTVIVITNPKHARELEKIF
jgi:trk system potassium uptake protein TrkA